MKIAYLLGSLNRGGLETLILDVLNNHDKAKFEMICIHRKDGHYTDDFKRSGVPIYKLGLNKFMFIFYILKLRKILKSNKIEIVHAQTSLDTCLAYFATCGTNIKIVASFHNFDFKARQLSKFALRWSTINIFVSHYQKSIYESVYKLKNRDKNQVVYNCVNFDKINNTDCNMIDMIEDGKSNNRIQLCMVGNFVRGREQNTVCRFLKLLKEQSVNFDFYFVGRRNNAEGWRFDDCVTYCKENDLLDSVHFLGGRGDVPSFLQQCDAFVYSTAHDTFGIAVVEAIGAGIPTFINDWIVMDEISNHGELATIYKTKDELDLFDRFMDFYNNRKEYKAKALNNAEKAKELYSVNTHLDKLYYSYKYAITKAY